MMLVWFGSNGGVVLMNLERAVNALEFIQA